MVVFCQREDARMEFVTHTLEPVYDERSKILILGSIPSPKSRQNGFYYGHPQNRFWPLLANLLHEPCPSSNEEKKHSCSATALLCGMCWRAVKSAARTTPASPSRSPTTSLPFSPAVRCKKYLQLAKKRQIYTKSIANRPLDCPVFTCLPPVRPIRGGFP